MTNAATLHWTVPLFNEFTKRCTLCVLYRSFELVLFVMYHGVSCIFVSKSAFIVFQYSMELFGLFSFKQQYNNNFANSVKNSLFLHSRGKGV